MRHASLLAETKEGREGKEPWLREVALSSFRLSPSVLELPLRKFFPVLIFSRHPRGSCWETKDMRETLYGREEEGEEEGGGFDELQQLALLCSRPSSVQIRQTSLECNQTSSEDSLQSFSWQKQREGKLLR